MQFSTSGHSSAAQGTSGKANTSFCHDLINHPHHCHQINHQHCHQINHHHHHQTNQSMMTISHHCHLLSNHHHPAMKILPLTSSLSQETLLIKPPTTVHMPACAVESSICPSEGSFSGGCYRNICIDASKDGFHYLPQQHKIEKLLLEKFTANLIRAAFTEHERATSNRRNNKKKLDPTKMKAIKEATFKIFPCSTGETEQSGWTACIISIDETFQCLNQKTARCL